jgi:hypothetical protein
MADTGIAMDEMIQQTSSITNTTNLQCAPNNLLQPQLHTDQKVIGVTAKILQKENKRLRQDRQRAQVVDPDWWKIHDGNILLPPELPPVADHLNNMCPSGLALHHPAADLLKL